MAYMVKVTTLIPQSEVAVFQEYTQGKSFQQLQQLSKSLDSISLSGLVEAIEHVANQCTDRSKLDTAWRSRRILADKISQTPHGETRQNLNAIRDALDPVFESIAAQRDRAS